MNLLSLLDKFNDKQIKESKKDFRKEFLVKVREEKRYCERNRTEPQMDEKKYAEIENMLTKCWTAYHIEALQRFVFTEMIVPDWKTVDERAQVMITEALHV